MDPDILKADKFLEGVNWPADKNEVASKAQDNGAPEAMVERLKNLGGGRFNGPQEVVSALQR